MCLQQPIMYIEYCNIETATDNTPVTGQQQERLSNNWEFMQNSL